MSYNFTEYGFPGYDPGAPPGIMPGGGYEAYLSMLGLPPGTPYEMAAQYAAMLGGPPPPQTSQMTQEQFLTDLFNMAGRPTSGIPLAQLQALPGYASWAQNAQAAGIDPQALAAQMSANVSAYNTPGGLAGRLGNFFDDTGLGSLLAYGVPLTIGAGLAGAFGPGIMGGGAAPAAAVPASGGAVGGGVTTAGLAGPPVFAGGAIPASVAAGAIPASSVIPTATSVTGAGVGGGALAGIGAGAIPASSVIPNATSAAGAVGNVASGAVGAGSVSIPGALSNLPPWLQNYGSLITGGLGLLDALSQPDSLTQNTGGTSSSTYRSQLPESLLGPTSAALSGLTNLYNTGYQVAPLPGIFNQSSDLASRVMSGQLNNQFASGPGNQFANFGGNPFANGVNVNTESVLSPFGLGANTNADPTASMFASGVSINPYLDQVFNTAANSTQNRLASEFALAGRFGSGSHEAARSQELQNLAAGIYGPGFEAERARQFGASEADVARRLAQSEANLGRLYGSQEAGVDRALNQREANLARILAATEANLGRQYGATEADLARRYAATEANLGRQVGSLPIGLSIADYGRLVNQQQLDAPFMNWQRLASGLQGLLPFYPFTQTQDTTQTGSVTQPLFNNPLAGLAGGYMLGQGIFGG